MRFARFSSATAAKTRSLVATLLIVAVSTSGCARTIDGAAVYEGEMYVNGSVAREFDAKLRVTDITDFWHTHGVDLRPIRVEITDTDKGEPPLRCGSSVRDYPFFCTEGEWIGWDARWARNVERDTGRTYLSRAYAVGVMFLKGMDVEMDRDGAVSDCLSGAYLLNAYPPVSRHAVSRYGGSPYRQARGATSTDPLRECL